MSATLILASSSPRRRELLRRLGVDFEVASADVDESARPGELPEIMAQRLAREKALAVASCSGQQPVLGADTIVVLDGQVLGKPTDPAEATAMLLALRGRTHEVLSAVYGWNPLTGRESCLLNRSMVTMRDYSDSEIAAYVASGDPMDKAGAYAIQNQAFAPVAGIDGCFSGVMGFPLGDVAQVLRQIGVDVPGDVAATCEINGARCCQVD